jgi:hypothetical protein
MATTKSKRSTSKSKSTSRRSSSSRSSSSSSGQAARQPTPRERLKSWPSRGYDGPQPWDLKGLGIAAAAADLEPGEPNTVAPVVVGHGHPVLTSGAAGEAVAELGRRLKALGYPTSISAGENPFNVYDDTVAQAVQLFRGEFNVHEDPAGFGGNHPDGERAAERHVGPYTWEAVIRASDRELEKAA